MRIQQVLFPVAALAFSGCNLVSGKCTYELRSLDAAGQINQNGAPFATAQLTLSEQRGSLQGQSMAYIVTSDALKGHVTAASFKDSSNPSQVLLDLPIASVDRPEITVGTAASSMGANLGGFHDILAAGHGMIELQTDLSGQLTVQIPLAATSVGDWIRPYCS
jgi:hypothetical protein